MIQKTALFILIILSSFSYGQSVDQEKEITKYKQVIASNVNDTIKVKAIKQWNQLIYLTDPQLDLQLNLQIDSICDVNLKKELSPKANRFYLEEKASATNIIGINYYNKGEYDQAISFYSYSYQMLKELGNKSGAANAVNNIGVVYFRQGKFDQALDYYNQGLALRLSVNDTAGIAGSYRNLATAYEKKGDYFKAIDYLDKEKALNQIIHDSISIATSFIEIGVINFHLENFEVTFDYFQKAKKILLDQNALTKLPRVYNALGACFEKTNDLDSAIYYYDLSIEISTKFNDPYNVAMAKHNKGVILVIKGEEEAGEELVRTSIKMYEDMGDLSGYLGSLSTLGQIMNERGDYRQAALIGDEILGLLDQVQLDLDSYMDTYGMIYTASKNLKNFQKALLYHEKYIEYRDSFMNNTNQKLLLQKEFESEMQADSIITSEFLKVKNAEISAEKSENKRRKQQGYYLVAGLGLTVLFGLFLLNRYRLTRQQNRVIEEQKKIVEAAHEEIRDSIEYAKRIQSALLPPNHLVKKHLPDSFILYLPKDVVAGDFYWMEQIETKTIFAAADCTGHGVPGAMVSVLCSNALSSSTREYGLTDPGAILNKTREIIIERFAQSEENVNDGMDVALVSIEKVDSSKTIVQYAGANNPIWIIRKNGVEIQEIKANKQPIGNYTVENDFETHSIELASGDQFFLFSDGYADQFGGDKGKKLKSKPFKELLLSMKDKSPEEQKTLLTKQFEHWRGKFEQIDDVLVIGVRI